MVSTVRAALKGFSAAALVVAVVAGCGGTVASATAGPNSTPARAPASAPGAAAASVPASLAPVTPAPSIPRTSVAPTVSAAAPPSPVATAAASGVALELLEPGRLVICSSFPRPRFAERDATGKAFGVDVEIGEAIADAMGLEPDIRELLFDDLIAAVETSRCDVSIAGQFITQGRLARIDMIPYREGTQHIVVQAGNPAGIRVLTDLCDRELAVVTGTIHVDIVRGTGDYAGTGIDVQCRTAGRPPVILREFPAQRQAEDALAAGEVDAYVGNDFVTVDRPADFALSAALPPARNGIGLRKGASALNAALRDAFRRIIDDGRYLAVLTRYGAEGARVTERP